MTTLLSINNYYYYRGGAETIFLEQNRLFEEAGWKVVPFAMTHPKNLPSQWAGYFVDEIEFGAEYSFLDKLSRLPKVIYSMEARRKLRSLIDVVQPDVCHAHNIYHHISPAILGLLRREQVPTVLTLHDLKIACPAYNMLAPDGVCERCRGGRLYNVIAHRCIKNSISMSAIAFAEAVLHKLIGSYRNAVSRLIVPSRFYIDKFVEWGMPASQFTHIPNFIDVRRFSPFYEPGNTFVYMGRISREKGVETLIRACKLAACKLRVIGTGPELERLQRLAVDLNADVTFLGYLSGESLQKAVLDARAVVVPSEWYENAPMSVLESYALGKPVIGARIGGIPELIRENETGVSFESGNVDSLASELRRMTEMSVSEIGIWGRSARRWIERDFTADRYRERLLDVYGALGVTTNGLRTAPPLL